MTDIEQIDYNAFVLNLARKAVDLAIDNQFYKGTQGEIAHKNQHPGFIQKHRDFQPPLRELETALDAQDRRGVTNALRQIMNSISKFESA